MAGNFRCFECGAVATCAHHPIPKSRGGTRTLPLCNECHALTHDLKSVDVSELTKEGMKRAKARGVKLGRPVIPRWKARWIKKFKKRGQSVIQIARKLDISDGTVRNYLKEINENTD